MDTLRRWRALSAADALSVSRDALLRAMVFVPLGLAAASRWLFPPALARIAGLLPFDLQALYPELMAYVLLLLAPTICGMLVGFLLLDQRDDRTLAALQVAPLSMRGYLAYRLAVPMLLSLLITLAALPLSQLVPLSLLELLALGVAAAPLAPLVALFLASYAANKVQGFALQKALGVLLLAPYLTALLPGRWGLLAGLAPTYWPAALLWGLQAQSSYAWAALPLGLAYQSALLWALLRRFERVIYR